MHKTDRPSETIVKPQCIEESNQDIEIVNKNGIFCVPLK